MVLASLGVHGHAPGLEVAWSRQFGVWNYLAASGGNIYALSREGTLSEYRGEDGKLLGNKPLGKLGMQIESCPDGGVCVVVDKVLTKLDQNLNVLWTADHLESPTGSGASIGVGEDGSIAVQNDNSLQIFDKDGKSGGQFHPDGMSLGIKPPVFLSKDLIAFQTGLLEVVSISERKLLWSRKVERSAASPVLFDDSLYAATGDGLVRVDSKKGTLVWSVPVGRYCFTPVALRDAVIVPTEDGIVGVSPNEGRVGLHIRLKAASHMLAWDDNYVMALVVDNSQVKVVVISPFEGQVVGSTQGLSSVSSTTEYPFIKVGPHMVACFHRNTLFAIRVN